MEGAQLRLGLTSLEIGVSLFARILAVCVNVVVLWSLESSTIKIWHLEDVSDVTTPGSLGLLDVLQAFVLHA